jgi:TonB family protein
MCMFAFMNALSSFLPSRFCYISRVVIVLLLCVASVFTGRAALAQSLNFDETARHLGESFREGQIHTVIVSDFVDDAGRVTLQGVLIADRLWFALLEEHGFETLNRDRLHMHLYGTTRPKKEALQKAEMNAAQVAGAEVVVTGNIEQDTKVLKINITVLAVSTGQKIAQRTFEVPRTPSLDDLAARFVQPDGPTYLVGQNGVTMPACTYCPTPQYTNEARKNRLEGKVVVSAIIDPSGKAEKILAVRGLSDGLTEQAVAVVRKWRFKPARDSKGKTVTVMVPLDVSFRLM